MIRRQLLTRSRDLHNHLVENNLRDQLWIDVPDLGGKKSLGITPCETLLIIPNISQEGRSWATPLSVVCVVWRSST